MALDRVPIRSAQRGPGYNQMAHIMEPLLDKAARELNIDRLAIRLANVPGRQGLVGPQRTPVTSSYLKEALEQGAPELRAENLRLAARALGRVAGRVEVEEVLDRLFGEFCIGK